MSTFRAFTVVAAMLLASLLAGSKAQAQWCSTDAQCSPYAGGINICLGDTLIMRRSLCVAGRCLTMEVGRQSCGTSFGGGICEGNTFVKRVGGCDALAGRCAPPTQMRMTCVQSCSCQGRRLTISTGICTPGVGCGVRTLTCARGCTCSPEARCLEDAAPKQRRGRR